MAILLGCNSTRVRKLKWALARRSSWSWQPLCFRRVQHPTSNLKIRTGTKPQLLSSSFGRATIAGPRSEEHTSELQSLMRISYDVFCLKKKHARQTFSSAPPPLPLPHVYTTLKCKAMYTHRYRTAAEFCK